MNLRPVSLFLCATMAFASFAPPVRAAEEPSKVSFSDPARPGTVKIILARGDLRVQSADTAEVTVRSDARTATKAPRKDGLRVLSAASSFSLSEKDNVVSLDAASDGTAKGGSDFRVTVPRGAAVIVQNSWGGNITCTGISGDIEINSIHGEIRLDDVAGGVVVSTMNGEIRADIRELREGKPLSFTSMNGEVQIRLPAEAKANVRLRTQNGVVLTDFEETALVTKTENSPGLPRGQRTMAFKGGKLIGPEVHEAIRGAAHASAVAVKQAMEAVREGVEAARQGAEEARQESDEARKAAERARLEATRERVRAKATERNRSAEAEPPVPPAPPVSPKAPVLPKFPTIPTISGGKLVTGTLNGGGPEISVSTMNGDVVLRKL